MTTPSYLAPARHWSQTRLAAVLTPLRGFVEESRSAGILLFIATAAALLLANGPFADGYFALLHSPLGFEFGGLSLRKDLLHWINDGLMTIFFVVVGLEIKREFVAGELSTRRAAALPVLAAVGGAILPACIYLLFNLNGPGRPGWAVPMATDIAFALGALSLLGSRVPITLKIFLTAVAIVDDLIAVLVIALFYSGELHLLALGLGTGLLCVLAACNYFGIRGLSVYGILGFLVWSAFLESGIHATIAGVLVAFTIPARTRIDVPTFQRKVTALTQDLDQHVDGSSQVLDHQIQHGTVLQIERLCEAVQAPLQRAEHSLAQMASLVVIPIFALANAGVPLSVDVFQPIAQPIGWGIVLGLCVGKPLGLMLSCWLAVRSGIADLPRCTSWHHVFGASLLAGVGFTMSIFIASLGFSDPALLTSAKAYILVASGIAITAGVAVLAAAPAEEQSVPAQRTLAAQA